jgi:hypothetical protein
MCARVTASSKESALRKLRRAISTQTGTAGELKVPIASGEVEYVEFYVSLRNIRLSHIDEIEGTAD